MIRVACENCGKQYRIDESRIQSDRTRFKCKSCGKPVLVRVPDFKTDATSLEKDEKVGQGEIESSRKPTRPRETAYPNDRNENELPGETGFESMEKADDPRKQVGISAKLIVVMLLVSILPLTIFWVIAVRDVTSRIQRDNRQLMNQVASGLATQVNEWMDKNFRVLDTAAGLSPIQSMDQELQEHILVGIQKNYPWMYLVFTLNRDGMNVARNDNEPLKDYSDRQYYKDIMAGKDHTWQTLIGKTSKKPALVIAVPIKIHGRVIGVMAAAMTIDEISQNVAQWKKGKTGFAFLVDEHGKVIAHQKKQFVLAQENFQNHPLVKAYQERGKSITLTFTDSDQEKYIGHVDGTRHGWALVLQQQKAEVMADLKKVQTIAVMLLITTIVIVFFIAFFSARAIVRPIKKLTEAAEKMSLGDLNVTISVSSRDEIANLAAALIRMQTSLRLAIERLRNR